MTRLNVAEAKPYVSQRDNVERPLITCNTTSMVMGLEYNGYNLPTRDPAYPTVNEQQPEDLLTKFMLTNEKVSGYYKCLNIEEWIRWQKNLDEPDNCIPPNEYHAVLAYGTNLWLGKEVVTFTTISIQSILFKMIQDYVAVVQSGKWAGLNHITCITGFETEQNDILSLPKLEDIDLKLMTNIIMQDPYGDYRTRYKEKNGKDIIVPFDSYVSLVKPLASDKKWVHLVKKNIIV
jgi:hypothetical protein